MSKVYKVIINGQKIERTYDDICHDLGFNPAVHFVCVTTANTISFYCGKPDEVKSLLRACELKGYKPAKSLVETARY